ncbi:MAG: YCF48-related protein [Steroidobacteraceae bacterium]|nr:hypothetical protein [Nevskiaceae bacterium]MCP5466124.1 hypothetical protein [Nevskiaceae bacterium]
MPDDGAVAADVPPRRSLPLALLLTLLAPVASAQLHDSAADPAIAVVPMGDSTAAPPSSDWLDRPAVIAPAASRSLLLGLAWAGSRMVVVGERGHVLLSDDQGRNWRQARAVPTRTMLTAVTFVDAQRGWAVGHDEIILHTTDGGETWRRQHWAPESQQPLLAVWFADATRGIAVGAYKAFFSTQDGGTTWTRQAFEPAPLPHEGPVDPEADVDGDAGFEPEYHLNAIAAQGQRLWIAAEAGQLYRSDDAGGHWQTLPTPYAGSFFGLLPLGGDTLLAFGLRGHLFRSDDAGQHWFPLETGTTAMLTDGAVLSQERIVLVGLSGVVLISADRGMSWTLHQQPDRRGLAAVLPAGDGPLVAVGEEGVRRIEIAAAAAGDAAAAGGAR